MSEHQYYEFRAVDRPLSASDRHEMRTLSSRASITSTRLVVSYDYGSFRGDETALLRDHFDAHFYYASYGEARLMLRLPPESADLESMRPCFPAGSREVSLVVEKSHVIVDLHFGEHLERVEVDESAAMDDLLPLRDELMRGDHRILYLAWLLCARCTYVDDDVIEPPVPAGLKRLSPAQRFFCKLFGLPKSWVDAAASASPDLGDRMAVDAVDWVRSLPAGDKDLAVAEFLEGRTDRLLAFRRNFESTGNVRPAAPARTVAELRALAARMKKERQREKRDLLALEEAERERQAVATRDRYLDELLPRAEQAWQDVESLIDRKRAAEYDQAIELLIDLRDLGRREGTLEQFQARLDDMRGQFGGRAGFIRRLETAGLATQP